MNHFYRFVIIAAVAALSLPAQAQKVLWSSGGVGVGTSSNNDYLNPWTNGYPFGNMNITDDGSGGAIMCWTIYGSSTSYRYTIYAQRVNGSGALVWTTANTGIQVASPVGSYTYQYVPQCVSDGQGGAYISWNGYDANIYRYRAYIQHISPTGQQMWSASGYSLSSNSEYSNPNQPFMIQMDKDGLGGVVLTWYTYTSNYTWGTVHAARITGDNGTQPQFAWGPFAVQSLNGSEYMNTNANPVIAGDGAGGALVGYQTQSGSSYYNHIAKISSTGSVAFNVHATTTNQWYAYGYYGYAIASDGSGGAILTYDPVNTNGYSGYWYQTQGVRVNSSGAVVWGPKAVNNPTYSYQYYGRTASDGNGGFYVLTEDNNWSFSDPTSESQALQHIDGSGNYTFNGTSGVNIIGSTFNYTSYAQVINDGEGNAICTWSYGGMVYVQKYNKSNGTVMWGSSPVKLTSSGYNQYPELQSDGAGGAFLVWNTNNPDVYTQHVMDTVMAPRATLTGNTTLNVGNVRVGASNIVNTGITLGNAASSNPSVELPLKITGSSSLLGYSSLANPPSGSSIAPGNSVSLSMAVSPKRNGAFTDTLYVHTNDPLNPLAKITVTGVGVYPHLTAYDTMNLGKQQSLALYSRAFTVQNTGTDTLHLFKAVITAGDSTSYSIVSIPDSAIAPGASGVINVGFTSISNGVKVSDMLIYSDDSQYVVYNTPFFVQLTGTGIFPHIVASSSLHFPYTVTDYRTSSLNWAVTNTGTEDLIITNGTSITGANASEFNFAPGTSFPYMVAPGTTGSLVVQFTPVNTFGPRTATLDVVSNFSSGMAPGGSADSTGSFFPVALTGTGVDGSPDMKIAGILNAGTIHTGKADTTTFTIFNDTDATKRLIIRQMVVQGIYAADYTLLNPPAVPDTLTGGVMQTFKLRFAPSQEGEIPAMLHIISNASEYASDIPIIGNGVKAALVATTVNFGNVATGKCKTMDLTVTNFGSAATTIKSFSLKGSYSSYYSYQFSADSMLQPGSFVNIPVQFCPQGTGAMNVVGQFVTSDGDTTYAEINGTGVYAGNLQTAGSVFFGIVAIAQTIDHSITIRNAGQTPATITDASITASSSPIPYSINLPLPIVVAPGDSITATVTFAPAIGGADSALLTLTTSDVNTATVHLVGYASADPWAAFPKHLFDSSGYEPQQFVEQTVYLKNFVKTPKVISNIRLVGGGASAYRLVFPISWPLSIRGEGGMDSIVVGFEPPTASKIYEAYVHVDFSDGDSVNISLDGSTYGAVGAPEPAVQPRLLLLAQNYPNPFGASTAIPYMLPERADATLTVFDRLGRTVATLVSGAQESGAHTARFDASALPPGVYYYELRVNSLVVSRMMQLVK